MKIIAGRRPIQDNEVQGIFRPAPSPRPPPERRRLGEDGQREQARPRKPGRTGKDERETGESDNQKLAPEQEESVVDERAAVAEDPGAGPDPAVGIRGDVAPVVGVENPADKHGDRDAPGDRQPGKPSGLDNPGAQRPQHAEIEKHGRVPEGPGFQQGVRRPDENPGRADRQKNPACPPSQDQAQGDAGGEQDPGAPGDLALGEPAADDGSADRRRLGIQPVLEVEDIAQHVGRRVENHHRGERPAEKKEVQRRPAGDDGQARSEDHRHRRSGKRPRTGGRHPSAPNRRRTLIDRHAGIIPEIPRRMALDPFIVLPERELSRP